MTTSLYIYRAKSGKAKNSIFIQDFGNSLFQPYRKMKLSIFTFILIGAVLATVNAKPADEPLAPPPSERGVPQPAERGEQ